MRVISSKDFFATIRSVTNVAPRNNIHKIQSNYNYNKIRNETTKDQEKMMKKNVKDKDNDK